jgi:2-polyprenyl-6-methoxyphenol hydroxylase-like FAD-dependent oxidoreductase
MNPNEHATRAGGTTDRSLPDEVEVAVVGAGPAGLTLAGMLSGYGIRTAVLDSAAGPARHSRAAIVHARTLETLKSLDVVGEMLGGGVVVTHFGVRDRDRLLLGVDFDGLPTAHPYTLMLPQDRTERILLGTLRERGGCGPATSSAATAGTASRGELSAYRSRAQPTPSPSCLRTCA